MELSLQQRELLERGDAVHLSEAGIACVLVRADVFARLKHLVYDDSPLSAEEQQQARHARYVVAVFYRHYDARRKQTGLRSNSVVQRENLVTREQSLIRAKIGALSPQMMQGVEGCLKAALGL